MSRLTKKRLDAAIAKQEPAIRRAFTDAIAAHQNGLDLAAIAAALEAGDIARAVSLAQITPAQLFALDAAITGAFVAGGQMVVDAAPKFAASFGFDGRADRADRWARANAAGLVQAISAQQGDALREMVGERLAAGANARKLAREVRSVVGLHPNQVRTVGNVRRDLTNLSAEYFTRTLRDRRFDGLVRRAIDDGKPLSITDIDRITQRYAERALRHRADVIARTESLNALRAGRDEGVRQAIEQGAASEAVKEWSASGDDRVREMHAEMDGVQVGIDEPFEMPNGDLMMYAGDSSLGAGPENVISCRCTISYRLTWTGN
jgi:hypothetical protein